MNLIALLISLCLDRFLKVGDMLGRFNWFEKYVSALKGFLKADSIWQGPLAVIVVALPVVVVLYILLWILGGLFGGVVSLLLTSAVLLYCFGPRDLYHQVNDYLTARDKKDDSVADLEKALLSESTDQKSPDNVRAVTTVIFTKSCDRLFSIIFWFIIIGPMTALFYRLTSQLHAYAKAQSDEKLLAGSGLVLGYLEWLPARLTAIFFGVFGDFSKTLSTWTKKALSGPAANDDVLQACGMASMGISEDSKADDSENKSALKLLDGALLMSVILQVIVSLFF